MDKKLYDILIGQFKRYPKMEACDAVKLLYQAEFGGGHRVQDEYNCMMRIEQEGSSLTPEQLSAPYFEEIGGGYCRMNLSVLQVIPVEVLGKMFIQSAGEEHGSLAGFSERLLILRRLCEEKKTGFTAGQLDSFLESYTSEELYPVSHSEAYTRAYAPAYRVVKKEYCKFLEVFVKISRLYAEGGEVTVAIDGQSAAGKTTLATLLPTVFDCNVFDTTDFASSPAGAVDVKRLEREVLLNLNTGLPFSYGIFDPEKGRVARRRAVPPKRLNIVEGTGSMHPKLQKYYELMVFMEVNPILQLERILRRDGRDRLLLMKEHMIPAEKAYIEQYRIKEKCDILYNIL